MLKISFGFIFIIFFVIIISVNANLSRIRRARVRHDNNTSIQDGPVGGRQQCEQIEYRLTRLEVQVAEKSDNLRAEMREGNRRLQALEYKSEEIHSNIEALHNELNRFAEYPPQGLSAQQSQSTLSMSTEFRKLELDVDNLSKGVQLAVTALRALNSDMAGLKRNISLITNITSELLHEYDNLPSKDFLMNSLIDLKHNHLQQQQQHLQPIFASSCGTQKQKEEDLPRNCMEILQLHSKSTSGFYLIQPDSTSRAFMVLCDMDGRDGGGWTIIHNRVDGSQDFYLNWHSYKYGFGNLGGEFWLGLEQIHQLTGSHVNELVVELVDANQEKAFAHYSAFSVGSEVEGYPLKILGGYSGNAGDSLIYHAGSKFSTKDMDQDNWPEGSCSQAHSGAWWYRGCDTSNLNGKYLNGELPEEFLYHGMYWGEFHGAQYSLLQARMMIRPRNENSQPLFPHGISGDRKN